MAVNSARDAEVTTVNGIYGSLSTLMTHSFKDVQTWQYLTLVIADVAVLLAMVLPMLRK